MWRQLRTLPATSRCGRRRGERSGPRSRSSRKEPGTTLSTAPASGGRNGADLLVEALLEANVEIVFGLPGVHNLALWRSLSHSPIRLVTVRHEQAAAYAADGYTRERQAEWALLSPPPGPALQTPSEPWGRHGQVDLPWWWWQPISRAPSGVPAFTEGLFTRRSTRQRCSPR